MLSGFAAASSVKEAVNNNLKKSDQNNENYDKFPGLVLMKSYSTHDQNKRMPDPKKCIIEMVKIQLKVKLNIPSL